MHGQQNIKKTCPAWLQELSVDAVWSASHCLFWDTEQNSTYAVCGRNVQLLSIKSDDWDGNRQSFKA
jgi:hypothetical protein